MANPSCQPTQRMRVAAYHTSLAGAAALIVRPLDVSFTSQSVVRFFADGLD